MTAKENTGTEPKQRISCPDCQKTFVNNSGFNKHARKGCKKGYCDVCDKSFDSIKKFQLHQKTHEKKEAEHVCKKCKQSFRHSWGLKEHSRGLICEKVRTTVEKFKCEICDAGYTEMRNLKVHMVKHSRNKTEHTCTKCDPPVSFTTTGSLTRHNKNKHVGVYEWEPEFNCDVCEKTFVNKGNLNKHMKSRLCTKVKLKKTSKFYKCQNCGISMSDGKRDRESKKYPASCNECGKTTIFHDAVVNGSKRKQVGDTLNTLDDFDSALDCLVS